MYQIRMLRIGLAWAPEVLIRLIYRVAIVGAHEEVVAHVNAGPGPWLTLTGAHGYHGNPSLVMLTWRMHVKIIKS
jgi:hypothetical protein